jgi:hypothetical protein
MLDSDACVNEAIVANLKVLCQYLSGTMEENHKLHKSVKQIGGRGIQSVLPEYKAGV